MRIYTIERDYDYQYFLPDVEKVIFPNSLGQPFPYDWSIPPFFIREPNLKRGNFVHWLSWVLITDFKATNELRDLLEMAGEMFDFDYKGEVFTLFNPLNTLSVLDEKNTVWQKHFKTGNKTETIEKYVFIPHRLGEEPIFKIPEYRAKLFTIEGMKNPEDEFKYRVESMELTGIKFKEVWKDDHI